MLAIDDADPQLAPHLAPPSDSIPPDDADEGDDDGDESDRWITVATFSLPQQAHIARLRLESEEIDCFLIDENLVATDWLLANAVGGIKVQVREQDADRARSILDARAVLPDSDDDDDADDDDEPAESESSGPMTCPKCGSPDVERTWFSRRLFFLAVLIGLPLPLPMRICRCTRCHHEWKQQRSGFPVNPLE
jgi:DNA-directed RNA polymerase subunit M/transcription elongation factor TFIIS